MDYLERYEANSTKPASPFVLLKPVITVLSGMPGQRVFRHALGRYKPVLVHQLVREPCEEGKC